MLREQGWLVTRGHAWSESRAARAVRLAVRGLATGAPLLALGRHLVALPGRRLHTAALVLPRHRSS
jgi:hypothetical protein